MQPFNFETKASTKGNSFGIGENRALEQTLELFWISFHVNGRNRQSLLAVFTVKRIALGGEGCFTYGSVVHNDSFVERLMKMRHEA